MFDGRVKTLHPRIHGGILMRRSNAQDVGDAETNGIGGIDLVVCNLYPFTDVIARPGTTLDEALEMIDIGGPTMIRAAAKSYPDVTVVVDPSDYSTVLEEMRAGGGTTQAPTRQRLALKVFATMAQYDAAIAQYLGRQVAPDAQFPPTMVKVYHKVQDCRYGENWDQPAAFYRDAAAVVGLQNLPQIQGKEISYNNFLDIDACMHVLLEFGSNDYVTSIFKHTTPNGVAVDTGSQLESCKRAFSTDPLSAFGGIWGFNTPLEAATADFIFNQEKVFVEVLIAPGFEVGALEIMATKQNLRVLDCTGLLTRRAEFYALPEIRGTLGGALVEEYDWKPLSKTWEVQAGEVTAWDRKGLEFAYAVTKYAKSNSAVFVKAYETGFYTLGVGAGQQSRVHVVKLAAQKAQEFGHDLQESLMGTDSFFPFPDGLEAAVEAGARAILTPGGSMRDADVVQRAKELGVALVFNGKRVFRH
jgi:phosphoribosylaminoimidazolecarboxamide formyltransferase/IMP cyclohydrolase